MENLHYTLLLLIPLVWIEKKIIILNLHYTLLLLIRQRRCSVWFAILWFTLHFATINTFFIDRVTIFSLIFTLHFATINTLVFFWSLIFPSKFTLHFATINTTQKAFSPFQVLIFTLHFATINTLQLGNILIQWGHLHYTLLLLIRTK